MTTHPNCHDSNVAASAPPLVEETKAIPESTTETSAATAKGTTGDKGPQSTVPAARRASVEKHAGARHVSFQIEEPVQGAAKTPAAKTPATATARPRDSLFTPSTWNWFNSNKRSSIGSTSSASSIIATPPEIKQQVHHLDHLLGSPLEIIANPLLGTLTLDVPSTHGKKEKKASRWSLDSHKETTAKEAEDEEDCTSHQSTDSSTQSTSSHLSGLQGLQLELERAQDEPIPAPSPIELHPVQPLPIDLFSQLEIMDTSAAAEIISPLGQEDTEESSATKTFSFSNQHDASVAAKACADKKAKPNAVGVAASNASPAKHTSTTSSKSSQARTTREKASSVSTTSQHTGKPNYLRATASSSRPSKISPMRQSTRSKPTGIAAPRALNPKSKLQAPTRSSLLKSQPPLRKDTAAQRVDTHPKRTFTSPRTSKKILGDQTNNGKQRRMSMICPPTLSTNLEKKKPTQVLFLPDTSHLLTTTANRKTVSKMHWTKRPPAPMDPLIKTHNRIDYQWCHHCQVWNTEHGTKQHNIFHVAKKRPSKAIQDPDASFSTVA